MLPLVAGDRIVGRADLKADRKAGCIRLLAYHPERGFRSTQPLERALDRLARTLGLTVDQLDWPAWSSRHAPSTPARSPIRRPAR